MVNNRFTPHHGSKVYKCHCIVCVVGDKIINKYGEVFWEYWADLGLEKEGVCYYSKNKLTILYNEFIFNLHFNKVYITALYYYWKLACKND